MVDNTAVGSNKRRFGMYHASGLIFLFRLRKRLAARSEKKSNRRAVSGLVLPQTYVASSVNTYNNQHNWNATAIVACRKFRKGLI